MFIAIAQYKATGDKGGYVLQWQGPNKPSYIIGKNNTCHWYKHKVDALKGAETLNRYL